MAAFPSWFLRITCDRCGKVQMVNEAPARWRDRSLRPPRSGLSAAWHLSGRKSQHSG